MIVVCVIGPYTAPDSWQREQNIRRAEEMSTLVMSLRGPTLGVMCVHTMSRYWYGHVGEAHAIDWGLEMLRRSDIVVVCEGWRASAGTCCEIQEAAACHKYILADASALRHWHSRSCRLDRLHEWMPEHCIDARSIG